MDSRTSGRGGLKDAALSLPKLAPLLLRLARDPRVPRRNKLIAAAISAYLVLPLDVIPDWVPGIGRLDDLILVALALDTMLNGVSEEIVQEHWDGSVEALQTIRSALAAATSLVPERIREKLSPSAFDDEE